MTQETNKAGITTGELEEMYKKAKDRIFDQANQITGLMDSNATLEKQVEELSTEINFYQVGLNDQERYIMGALVAARSVQDFLWGEGLNKVEPEKLKDVCLDMFQKRIDKLKEIDFTNKSSIIELRKRILQNAAISIKMLEQLQSTQNQKP